LQRRTRDESGKNQTEHIHDVTVGVTYQWRLPTVDLTRKDPSNEPIVEYTHGQELPGISSGELADHFCDFLALNQLRTWAQQNLKAIVGKQVVTEDKLFLPKFASHSKVKIRSDREI
jgi:hypothetical protein